jgi:large subunit ribosomal protein L18
MARSQATRRDRIKHSIRNKITGTDARPRLTVFRSNTGIYAQLINDTKGVTILGAATSIKEIKAAKGSKTEKSKLVGLEIAKRAIAAGIDTVVFDRNGFQYHGRIKALAEGAREGGLKF